MKHLQNKMIDQSKNRSAQFDCVKLLNLPNLYFNIELSKSHMTDTFQKLELYCWQNSNFLEKRKTLKVCCSQSEEAGVERQTYTTNLGFF